MALSDRASASMSSLRKRKFAIDAARATGSRGGHCSARPDPQHHDYVNVVATTTLQGHRLHARGFAGSSKSGGAGGGSRPGAMGPPPPSKQAQDLVKQLMTELLMETLALTIKLHGRQ